LDLVAGHQLHTLHDGADVKKQVRAAIVGADEAKALEGV
jgi:hypothetical protein